VNESYTNPIKPENARAIRPAVTRPMAVPSNGLGMLTRANLCLRPAITTRARAKPQAEAKERISR